MQRNKIRNFEELGQISNGARASERQLLQDIEEYDVHADGLREQTDLLTDMSVSDNPHGLVSNLDGFGKTLVPGAAVKLGTLFA